MSDTVPARSFPTTTAIGQRRPPENPLAAQTYAWHGHGFRIEVRSQPETGDDLPMLLSYRVFDDVWAGLSGQDPLIFAGDDLTSDPRAGISRQVAQALTAIFGCESGDIADTYFAAYSPAQLAWRDARAGDLGRWGSEIILPA